jgi:hypothetical protein
LINRNREEEEEEKEEEKNMLGQNLFMKIRDLLVNYSCFCCLA